MINIRYISRQSLTAIFTFLIVIGSNSIWALNIIDIDDSKFGTMVKHLSDSDPTLSKTSLQQVRVVDFDVSAQKLNNIFYAMTPANETEYTYTYKGLNISYIITASGFKININVANLPDDTWVISPGEIKLEQEGIDIIPFDLDKSRSDRKLIRKKGDGYKPAASFKIAQVDPFVGSKRRKAYRSPMISVSFSVEDFARSYILPGNSGIFSVVGKGNHDREQKGLGELATELTFFSYGFTKIGRKLNDADHGFDGAFVDSFKHPTELWITESKFTNRTWRKEDIIPYIDKKLKDGGSLDKYRMSKQEAISAVATWIDNFIATKRDKIHLLGQWVLKDGLIKAAYDPYVARFPMVKLPVPSSVVDEGSDETLLKAILEKKKTDSESSLLCAQEILKLLGLDKEFVITPKKKITITIRKK